jgi:NitT/TauT family transport system substrate-binding protein
MYLKLPNFARLLLIGGITAGLAFAAPGAARAETVKIGVLKFSFSGPVFIALERGYFAAEGLTPRLVFFESGQPIAPALVAGELDFGASGLTGGFYSLAAQGALRIIGGLHREAPSFHTQAIVASSKAFERGLKSFKDLQDQSFGISQFGSPAHYSLVLLAVKYGLDLKSIRLLPLQSIPNVMAALGGGHADATILPVGAVLPGVQRGELKLLGWVGDETPFQIGAVYTRTKIANEKRSEIERFLRALQKGERDYHDAFADAEDRRRDGPDADAIARLIAGYTGETPERVKAGIAAIDAQGRLDVDDILRQIAWYKSQNIVKASVDGAQLVDRRYVVPLR